MRLAAARAESFGDVEDQIDSARSLQYPLEKPAPAAQFHGLVAGSAESAGDAVDGLFGIVFLQKIIDICRWVIGEIRFQIVGDADADGALLSFIRSQASGHWRRRGASIPGRDRDIRKCGAGSCAR